MSDLSEIDDKVDGPQDIILQEQSKKGAPEDKGPAKVAPSEVASPSKQSK